MGAVEEEVTEAEVVLEALAAVALAALAAEKAGAVGQMATSDGGQVHGKSTKKS